MKESQSPKKYELTDETRIVNGRTVYRIRYLKDVHDAGCTSYSVKRGERGGFVEGEGNLSHRGDAVVLNNSVVCERAKVLGDTIVRDNAIISGHAILYNSRAQDGAEISGFARLIDSYVSGRMKIDAAIVMKGWGGGRYWTNSRDEGDILTRARYRAENIAWRAKYKPKQANVA